MLSPFCGPELVDIEHFSSLTKGYSSYKRRCFYKYDSFDLSIDYLKKFWEAYKGHNKYLKLDYLDAHEPTGENVKTTDGPLA